MGCCFKKKWIYLLSFLIIVFYLSGCQTHGLHLGISPLKSTRFVLGTTVTLSLYDHQSNDLLNQAFDLLNQMEDLLSINKPGTLLDKINAQAGISPVKVDNDTYSLIEKGLYYSELTSGSFDITIGPLVQLWHIGFPDARIPSPAEIKEILPLISYENVRLDSDLQTIYLQKSGMALDLGGIAKGWATDKIVQLFKSSGVEHALINLGGNVYTLGTKPDGSLWTVGIQDPFNPRGETLGTIKLANQSAVTSGIYERYLEAPDGTTYHHLLNPDDGWPYTNGLAGVTIISSQSADGDALSTAAFGMGLSEGLAFIEGLTDMEAVFVTTDHKIYITSGLTENFTLTAPDFTLGS